MYRLKYDYLNSMNEAELTKFLYDPVSNVTPLHLAVLRRNYEQIKTLLADAKTSPNSQDINLNSPFHHVFLLFDNVPHIPIELFLAPAGQAAVLTELIDLFLRAGADPRLRNAEGQSVLDLGVQIYEDLAGRCLGVRQLVPVRHCVERVFLVAYTDETDLERLFEAINYALRLESIRAVWYILASLEANAAIRDAFEQGFPERKESVVISKLGEIMLQSLVFVPDQYLPMLKLKVTSCLNHFYSFHSFVGATLNVDEGIPVMFRVLEKLRTFDIPFADLSLKDGIVTAYCRGFFDSLTYNEQRSRRFYRIMEKLVQLRFPAARVPFYESLALEGLLCFFNDMRRFYRQLSVPGEVTSASGDLSEEKQAEIRRHYRVFLPFCSSMEPPALEAEELSVVLGITSYSGPYLSAFEDFFDDEWIERVFRVIAPFWRPSWKMEPPSLQWLARRVIRMAVLRHDPVMDDVGFIKSVEKLPIPRKMQNYLRFIDGNYLF